MNNFQPDATSRWSTADFPAADRFDAWEEQLTSAYGHWHLALPSRRDFSARMQLRSLDGLKIIECVCDPCAAVRTPRMLGRDDREVLGLQLVIAGRERVHFGGEEILLHPGDILLWDNARPMSFEVVERLHKLSFVLPLSRLQSWLPATWHAVDHKIEARSLPAGLLSVCMESMATQFLAGAASNGDALIEATVGLLVNAVTGDTCPPSPSLRAAQLTQIKMFIDEHLDNPEMTPTRIAKANRISVRYLHWLFEPSGMTVSRYIIDQRLRRCHRELSNPAMDHRTITDIAFSWGFHNPTHFSRRFKQAFDLSPRDFRKRTQSNGSND